MTGDSTAAIRFRIGGTLRFLSHAETFRVFHRACARAMIPVRYTEGFNPHPRLSLPLPRPVGVESEDELLVAKLYDSSAPGPVPDRAEREAALKQALAAQIPEGMEVLAVDLGTIGSFQPHSAEYVLPVRENQETDRAALRDRIGWVMQSEHCTVERTAAEGKASRPVDVRPFLLGIRWEGNRLIVQHATGGAGSIRVEEILLLLGLRGQDLAGPICRRNVVWETTKPKDTRQEPCMETRAKDVEKDGT